MRRRRDGSWSLVSLSLSVSVSLSVPFSVSGHHIYRGSRRLCGRQNIPELAAMLVLRAASSLTKQNLYDV
jgi:hypothetical protein